jgi:hypothetical protein
VTMMQKKHSNQYAFVDTAKTVFVDNGDERLKRVCSVSTIETANATGPTIGPLKKNILPLPAENEGEFFSLLALWEQSYQSRKVKELDDSLKVVNGFSSVVVRQIETAEKEVGKLRDILSRSSEVTDDMLLDGKKQIETTKKAINSLLGVRVSTWIGHVNNFDEFGSHLDPAISAFSTEKTNRKQGLSKSKFPSNKFYNPAAKSLRSIKSRSSNSLQVSKNSAIYFRSASKMMGAAGTIISVIPVSLSLQDILNANTTKQKEAAIRSFDLETSKFAISSGFSVGAYAASAIVIIYTASPAGLLTVAAIAIGSGFVGTWAADTWHKDFAKYTEVFREQLF